MLTEILQNPFLFYGLVLCTSILSAATGTGGGFILIPLASLQFGAKEGVGILSIYFLFQNINKLIVFRQHIQWKVAKRFIIWALPGVLVGSLALSIIPVEAFTKILAVIILLYLANDLLKIIPNKAQPETLLPGLGFLYGFLSGLIGSGNMVKGPLFTSLGMRKEMYIATYAFTSMFMNVPKILSYASTGIIDSSAIIKSIPFLILSIVGTYIGKHFLKYIRHDVFYYIITASFALSAIALLLE